jgi:transcriptional regulator with XRE-family HTH domain
MSEARLGGKLRRLRQERRLNQTQMAERLGISASYLNLLEHNQRPVTVPVLLKLAQRFAVDLQTFAAADDDRLLSDLMEAFADPLFDGDDIKAMDLKDLVATSPNLGRGLLTLDQAYRGNRATGRELDAAGLIDDNGVATPAGMPSEEV